MRPYKRYIPSKLHTDFRFGNKSISKPITSIPLRFISVSFASKCSFKASHSLTDKSVLSCLSFQDRFLPFWSSPRPISNSQLHTLLYFHLCPIYLILFQGSYSLMTGISHLGGGLPLRCIQRLSLPDLATLLCCWYNNRYTSGPSIPVLSY